MSLFLCGPSFQDGGESNAWNRLTRCIYLIPRSLDPLQLNWHHQLPVGPHTMHTAHGEKNFEVLPLEPGRFQDKPNLRDQQDPHQIL